MSENKSIVGGEPLTQDQVDALPDGADVEVIWSGGNGPHRYRIVRDKWGIVRVTTPRTAPTHAQQLGYVGRHPQTEVRLVED